MKKIYESEKDQPTVDRAAVRSKASSGCSSGALETQVCGFPCISMTGCTISAVTICRFLKGFIPFKVTAYLVVKEEMKGELEPWSVADDVEGCCVPSIQERNWQGRESSAPW